MISTVDNRYLDQIEVENKRNFFPTLGYQGKIFFSKKTHGFVQDLMLILTM
jgi:hypothetical protein